MTQGTLVNEINDSLQKIQPFSWSHFNKLEPKTNIRVPLFSCDNRFFSEMLIIVGNGKSTQNDGRINLEDLCVLIDNIQ